MRGFACLLKGVGVGVGVVELVYIKKRHMKGFQEI